MNENQDLSMPQRQQEIPVAVPAVVYKKSGTAWKVIVGILLGLSILANIFLLLVVGVLAIGTPGERITEKVLQHGPANTKIVSIKIDGIIDGELAERVIDQLSRAGEDGSVKAVILRINSPGGYMCTSDEIHRAIMQLTDEKPVVAFMQGVATSGAYYISAPSMRIVAEPTTITGSIGVIVQLFIFEGLLKDKLGITPITMKAGEKKDWPNIFEQITPEQQEFIEEVLIKPSFERFKNIVASGRKNLTEAQVEELADGRILMAPEALKAGLIDKVGYFDDAVEEAKILAGVTRARVVEYEQLFRLSDILTLHADAKKVLKLEPSSMLIESGVPRVMYLWTLY